MENEFIEVMRLKTNAQLFLILRNNKDYNLLAIEAVKIIINERNLSDYELQQEQDHIDDLGQVKELKAQETLESHRKVLNLSILYLG
ncbi:hypothetical protein N9811_01400 [Bacteroidia bacterium]|jgi:hypothetical protein|nr:hypothetical protein [Bacteroidota bacterium]MDB4173445.1 hypothetical protein [Bacteroidia bacterium]